MKHICFLDKINFPHKVTDDFLTQAQRNINHLGNTCSPHKEMNRIVAIVIISYL